MNWPSGQLTAWQTDLESPAQEAVGPLSSVAYVGTPIGGPNSLAGAETGELFFAVFRSYLWPSQTPVVRFERLGNVRDFEKSGRIQVSKRSNHEGLAILRKMREESATKDRGKQERDWLARHRQEYAGQWVALLGNRLISHSTSAKEVFSAANAAGVDALVLRIEDKKLRFAGW
jgi:Family of unknown function (DUF5678)